MKKIICLLGLLALLPAGAFGEKHEISDMDGTDWAEWPPLQKYSFMSGFISGTSFAVTNNIQTQDDKYDSNKASAIYVIFLFPDDKKTK